jgi:hypothetical protein
MASDEPTETPVPSDDAEDGPPESVFGNLPRERPGLRSPRRGEQASPVAARERAAPAQPPPSAERQAEEARASPEATPAPGAQGGGIEDVAWAGVAAAAEAATIGVRLATRALEAMRDAVDRR